MLTELVRATPKDPLGTNSDGIMVMDVDRIKRLVKELPSKKIFLKELLSLKIY